jgi:hypothetical protein
MGYLKENMHAAYHLAAYLSGGGGLNETETREIDSARLFALLITRLTQHCDPNDAFAIYSRADFIARSSTKDLFEGYARVFSRAFIGVGCKTFPYTWNSLLNNTFMPAVVAASPKVLGTSVLSCS